MFIYRDMIDSLTVVLNTGLFPESTRGKTGPEEWRHDPVRSVNESSTVTDGRVGPFKIQDLHTYTVIQVHCEMKCDVK